MKYALMRYTIMLDYFVVNVSSPNTPNLRVSARQSIAANTIVVQTWLT
jgi:dihydroorotate dehydrogenase